MVRLDRETMIVSAGASVGVIQTILMKEYVDVNFGTIPFIGDYIPAPWNRWSTLGNMLIGGICFGLSVFTNVIRNSTLNTFLKVYGVTTLVGGIMNGVFATPAFAARRAPVMRARTPVRAQSNSFAPVTHTAIPATQFLA